MKIGVAFGVCVILFSLFGDDHGVHAVLKARRDARRLAAAVAALRAENAALRAEAGALESDPGAIEAVARGTLGMARPDELILTRAALATSPRPTDGRRPGLRLTFRAPASPRDRAHPQT